MRLLFRVAEAAPFNAATTCISRWIRVAMIGQIHPGCCRVAASTAATDAVYVCLVRLCHPARAGCDLEQCVVLLSAFAVISYTATGFTFALLRWARGWAMSR